ncbi:hypothetical protein KL86DYS2_20093 [uncultured Dysgonomonas sp.]|uniref:Uncharacterized protein n=1 Tax=uncultured Dysgonomonas sp. TaxID=206096 RepID=A0A212KFN0_9BACT|nr:hypothetical protein KL86DYS2_20093 [uncultured Dysgonomonas sp.]
MLKKAGYSRIGYFIYILLIFKQIQVFQETEGRDFLREADYMKRKIK